MSAVKSAGISGIGVVDTERIDSSNLQREIKFFVNKFIERLEADTRLIEAIKKHQWDINPYIAKRNLHDSEYAKQSFVEQVIGTARASMELTLGAEEHLNAALSKLKGGSCAGLKKMFKIDPDIKTNFVLQVISRYAKDGRKGMEDLPGNFCEYVSNIWPQEYKALLHSEGSKKLRNLGKLKREGGLLIKDMELPEGAKKGLETNMTPKDFEEGLKGGKKGTIRKLLDRLPKIKLFKGR